MESTSQYVTLDTLFVFIFNGSFETYISSKDGFSITMRSSNTLPLDSNSSNDTFPSKRLSYTIAKISN